MKTFSEFLLETYHKQEDDDNIIHLDEKTLEAILKLVGDEDSDDLVKKLIRIIKEVSKTVDNHVLVFDHFKVVEDKLRPDDEEDEDEDEDEDSEDSEDNPEESEESEIEVPAGDVIDGDSTSDSE